MIECSSGKKRWDNVESAKSAAILALQTKPARSRGLKRLAVYFCVRCYGWHLTRQTTNKEYVMNRKGRCISTIHENTNIASCDSESDLE
jgi:hypothetical protein